MFVRVAFIATRFSFVGIAIAETIFACTLFAGIANQAAVELKN